VAWHINRQAGKPKPDNFDRNLLWDKDFHLMASDTSHRGSVEAESAYFFSHQKTPERLVLFGRAGVSFPVTASSPSGESDEGIKDIENKATRLIKGYSQ
jgi:hypothetical protein